MASCGTHDICAPRKYWANPSGLLRAFSNIDKKFFSGYSILGETKQSTGHYWSRLGILI